VADTYLFVYSLRIPKTEEEARRVLIVIIDLSEIKLAPSSAPSHHRQVAFLSSMSHENSDAAQRRGLVISSYRSHHIDNEQFELVDDADKAAKALLGLIGTFSISLRLRQAN